MNNHKYSADRRLKHSKRSRSLSEYFVHWTVGVLWLCLATLMGMMPAHAAPVYQSSQTSTGTTNSLSISKPTGTASNNLLLATLSARGTTTTITAPTGWRQLQQLNNGTNETLAVFYRVADASDGSVTSYTFTLSSSVGVAGAILRYSGVDTSDPVNASDIATGTSTTATAPAVTTTVADTTVVRIAGIPNNGTLTVPTGTSERVNIVRDTSGNNNDTRLGVADATQTNPGSTNPAAFANTSGAWVAATIVLRAPPVPSTTIAMCGIPGKDGSSTTLSGMVNTYYPGTATANAGATSITVGAATGDTTKSIAANDLLLVIQMQDSAIDYSNTASYGGITALNSAGLYEFVKATGPVSGGSVPIQSVTSPGSGLLNTYTDANATATRGQRHFQVVRVPQYASATVTGTITAPAWNGSTGGIVVLDVAGTLAFNSGTSINVDAKGFRGGLGQGLTGIPTAGSGLADYMTLTGVDANGNKGEGVAGSPNNIYDGTTTATAGSGYPTGSASTGSRARGAPGNAGGGGTDGAANNSQNSGGGGGGNGGAGGQGGNTWSSNNAWGGIGGAAFPYAAGRLAMGGGGGSGSRNNSADLQSSGGLGGGLIIVRANSITVTTGTATLSANGSWPTTDNYTPAEDGGGGGGAGGGVLVFARNQLPSTLTINAQGGKGANTWPLQPSGTCPGSSCNYHGPGGGGAGGVVYLSSAGPTVTVTGGVNGTTTTAQNAYNATPGASGASGTLSESDIPGITSGATCSTADLAITNTDGVTAVGAGSTVTYTVVVSNTGPSAANGATVTDTLPAALTGATWTCVAAGGAVCPATSGSGSISQTIATFPSGGSLTYTITGTVSASATGTLANTATVTAPSGVTDPNTSNDSATDTDLIINAVDDSATINGGTGGSTSVLTNDTNGGSSATVGASGNVTLTNLSGGTFPSGGSALSVDPATGLITVPAGATPGTYTVPYQICDKTVTTACDTATATVTVQGSNMTPSFTGGGLPTAIGPGQTIKVTGGLTCTNSGPGSATSPTCTASTTTSGATVSTANCTSPSLPLAVNGTIVCDLVITAPSNPSDSNVSATSVAVTGSTSAANDTVSSNNTVSGSVNIIDAVDDSNLGTVTVNSTTSGTTTDSVLVHDTNGGAAATTSNVTISANNTQSCTPSGSGTCTTLTLNANGTITVPAGATPGTYTVTYEICDLVATTACDTATATLTVSNSTTQALIGSFRAYISANGQTMVEWETVSEVNTVGFNLFREDPASGKFFQVNTRLLPGLFTAPQGGVYRYPDLTVAADGTYTYRLQEVEADGTLRDYGPFTVTVAASTSQPQAMRATQAQTLAAETLADADGYERAAHALSGRTVASSAAQPMAASQTSTPNTMIRILVKQDGLYTVSADQIAAALAVTSQTAQSWINTGMVRLQQGGQSVAWQADSSGTRLYFYGQAIQGVDSVYTPYNVYWLDHSSGVTMNVLSGKGPTPTTSALPFQSSIHVEQNLKPAPSLLTDPDADFWFWNYALAGDATLSAPQFAVPVPNPATTGTVTLRVALQGATDLAAGNDHHAHVLVNGTEVGDAAWDGITPYVLTATFDAALLTANGNNTITVRGTLDPGVSSSVFWVNGFDVDYLRTYQATNNQLRLRGATNSVVTVSGFGSADMAVLDISNPRQPQWVAATTVTSAGTGYAVSFTPATPSTDYVAAVAVAPVSVTGVVASTLKTQTSGADYLVLTPTALRTGADALAAYRGGKVVELQDIYDAFNYGIANPHAIRDFLSYAYDQWQPQPHYVALVGKGTLDPKDYKGLGTNLFPVLMAATPSGLFAADNRYADIRNDDGLPELAVGRIPALTNADVQNYIAKLKTYDGNSPLATALLVADNPDSGGNFTADSQAVADMLQQNHSFTTTPIYFQTGGAAATTRQQIISALNAGVGLFNYVGHGGVQQLAAEGLLRNADTGQLTNGARLPVFLAFTCYVGNGSNPGTDSLTEALLWSQSGGIVAAVAPMGLSDAGQAHTLNLSLVDSLFGVTPVLGDATIAAKANLAMHKGSRSMLDTYQVLGDPALRVKP